MDTEEIARHLSRLTEIPDLLPSRRERIATACLAGMLADPAFDPPPAEAARRAIACADALIAALDAPKETP